MSTVKLEDCTKAFAVAGARNIIDLINPHTDLGLYSGLDLAAIRARDKKDAAAEIVNCQEFFETIAKRQDEPVTWEETTAENYDEMLNVLPPAFWQRGLFLVGEPMDHHMGNGRPRFPAYRRAEDKFFAASRPMTIREAREFLGA